MLEFALSNLMSPGKVESLIVVVDMTGVGTINIPVSALKTIGQMLQNNYRARLYKLYCLNTPLIVKGLWTVVKTFLEDFTVAKVNVLRTDYGELYKQIDKQQLEEKLGGTYPTITEDYYPPKQISN